ncbi:hypothetical protein [Prauserella endophytica]|uniref:HTH cro/C1-type domain-containing protein n=1 Tax=Prauserella endophytica TaxID=1592324 RepID=A0ABY2RVA2_9PSEU|nr:hypothetical protein [Prauserella endophytica]TKG61303.1 hypothetical protein FCN18_33605 [Prauserella endophytica]
METRRKTLGRRIKAARRAAGHKSARSFADAIGVSESSVANAEIGSERVGEGVYLDIESGLGWPTGCIRSYLETGEIDKLPSGVAVATPKRDEMEPQDDYEEMIINSSLARREKLKLLRGYRKALDEERRVLQPDQRNHPHVATPSNNPETSFPQTRKRR